MNFFVKERDSGTPVEFISQAGGVFRPHALNFLTPTGLEFFVQIKADADVYVFWDKGQRSIARIVKAPWCDANWQHLCAMLLGKLDGIVG